MIALFLIAGAFLVMKGFMLRAGRTVPKGIVERIRDKKRLRGWCKGTGTVNILWGVCCLMLWCANQFIPYALYSLACFAVCAVSSIVVAVMTTKKYADPA